MQQRNGELAKTYCNLILPLQVLRSAAGFYIGTANEEGPVSRESADYWRNRADAERALETGNWVKQGDVLGYY